MKVELTAQVIRFVRSQPPEPRRVLRSALRQLEQERGDIRPLQEELEGCYRLRISRFRIVFQYAMGPRRQRRIRCVYAATRGLVYEVFAQQLHELI
jgi:mRNA interferase RelE/StbE